MFESLRTVPPMRQPRVLAKFVAGIDYLVPFLDIGYIFFWIPGLILFVFGYPLIVSWISMLVIPITLALYGLLRRWQERHVFRRFEIHPERDAAASGATCSPTRRSRPRRRYVATRSTSSGTARSWEVELRRQTVRCLPVPQRLPKPKPPLGIPAISTRIAPMIATMADR